MSNRADFEAWAIRNTSIPSAHEMAWAAWQAATLAERERAAKVCERERMVRGGEVFAAEIRKG